VNDASFAMDASEIGANKTEDTYHFFSEFNQFLTVNAVPYGADNKKGSWSPLSLSLQLSCAAGTGKEESIAKTTTEISSSTPLSDLMPYITTRVRAGERCSVQVSFDGKSSKNDSASPWLGYYLFVTGSGLAAIDGGVRNDQPDVWGPRMQEGGKYAFNVNGPHQTWIPYPS
jgi:hypothetical protein